MRVHVHIFVYVVVFFFTTPLSAQYTVAFPFLSYPRSSSAFGMGNNAVAFQNRDGALFSNPANLSFANTYGMDFYHEPFQAWGFGTGLPLNSLTFTAPYSDVGVFALNYSHWDFGKIYVTTPQGPDPSISYDNYYRNITAGFARGLSEHIRIGATLTYADAKLGSGEANFWGLSLGMHHFSESPNSAVSFGAALMNIGNTIQFKPPQATAEEDFYKDPPPTFLNFGAGYTLKASSFRLPFQIAFTKFFDRKAGDNPARPSWESIFQDWSDFPQDVSLHFGVGFEWMRMDLGRGFTFHQSMYLGDYSGGPKAGTLRNIYTHGIEAGFGYRGAELSAGYSGWWHNVIDYSGYLPMGFPPEKVEFRLRYAPPENSSVTNNPVSPKKIIVSTGASFTIWKGKVYPISNGYSYRTEIKNGTGIDLQTAFYFTLNAALVTCLSYDFQTISYFFPGTTWKLPDLKSEIISLFSGYRLHPVESFNPFYLQAGARILRWNPIQTTAPRYFYKTELAITAGAVVPLYQDIIIEPKIDFTCLLAEATGKAPRIAGYNSLVFGVQAGYIF